MIHESNGSVHQRVEITREGDFRQPMGGRVWSPSSARCPRRSSWRDPLLALAGLQNVLQSLFHQTMLPEGYPNSVTPDYAAYQFWDTVQCLCSSVTGTMSTRAVLLGVGVGAAEADVASSTVSWIIRDGVSMVSRIWLAAHISSGFDADAKRWRLTADITNDLALALEVFSSYLPAECFLPCVCAASVLKSICGVSAGSSKAALTQHFAKAHNTADLSAKEGSQETFANLVGMFLGMFVAWLVPATSLLGTLVVFLAFTGFHLYSNYRAVRSLCLTHFNTQRLEIVLATSATTRSSSHHQIPYLMESLLSPQCINWKERVVLPSQQFMCNDSGGGSAALLPNIALGTASLTDWLRKEIPEARRFEVHRSIMTQLRDTKFALLCLSSRQREKGDGRAINSSENVYYAFFANDSTAAAQGGVAPATPLLCYLMAYFHSHATRDAESEESTTNGRDRKDRHGSGRLCSFDPSPFLLRQQVVDVVLIRPEDPLPSVLVVRADELNTATTNPNTILIPVWLRWWWNAATPRGEGIKTNGSAPEQRVMASTTGVQRRRARSRSSSITSRNPHSSLPNHQAASRSVRYLEAVDGFLERCTAAGWTFDRVLLRCGVWRVELDE